MSKPELTLIFYSLKIVLGDKKAKNLFDKLLQNVKLG